MNPVAETVRVIDVRRVAPPQRHPAIFDAFETLPEGGALELVNDHDPVPLHRQFEQRHPGRFGWSYLEAGPAIWRVLITPQRTAAAVPASECCGSCSCR